MCCSKRVSRVFSIPLYTFLFFFCTCSENLLAQKKSSQEIRIPDSLHIQLIKTSDGLEAIGRVVSISDSGIVFSTAYGDLIIPEETIVFLEEYFTNEVVRGKLLFNTPNESRLFLSPTAFPLKKNTGYVQNIYLFFLSASYGLTNHISISGASSFLYVYDYTMSDQIYYLNVRCSQTILKNTLTVSGGIMGGNFFSHGLFSMGYGLLSFGTKNLNLTVLGAIVYKDRINTFVDHPLTQFGFAGRLGRWATWITEFWLIPEKEEDYAGRRTGKYYSAFYLTNGVRIFNKRFCLDIGLHSRDNSDGLIAPYLGGTASF